MEKEKMQQAAHTCLLKIGNTLSKHCPPSTSEVYKNYLAIQSKLEAAQHAILPIKNSDDLLYNFFFPFCEELDAVFYDQTYKRNLFGNSQLQQKIIGHINDDWKYFNAIAFEAQDSLQQQKLLVESLIACRRLYTRRHKKSIPAKVAAVLNNIIANDLLGMTYKQLGEHIKRTIEHSSGENKHFFSFLAKFLIYHPPIVGRARKKVKVAEDNTMYVDIWSSTTQPKARMLYLHGWHDSPDSAKLLAQLAINGNIEVHAIHLPGHGLNFSLDYIAIADLQKAFLNYYNYLAQDTSSPLILAGHSMGGAILTSCLTAIASEQLRQVILFAPAFSKKRSDMFQEKMPWVHKNLNRLLNEENKKNLLRGGRGPAHPVVGIISRLFFIEGDNLYTLMQEGYRQFVGLGALPVKIMLIYGQRDHCINYTVLQSIERHAGVVIQHAEFDHGPHLFPGCGGSLVTKSVLKAVHTP